MCFAKAKRIERSILRRVAAFHVKESYIFSEAILIGVRLNLWGKPRRVRPEK